MAGRNRQPDGEHRRSWSSSPRPDYDTEESHAQVNARRALPAEPHGHAINQKIGEERSSDGAAGEDRPLEPRRPEGFRLVRQGGENISDTMDQGIASRDRPGPE